MVALFPSLALLLSGVALCLAGFGFFSRRSRPSCRCSEKLSQTVEESSRQVAALQLEWENTYHKLRSLAGRIARGNRRSGPPEANPLDPQEAQEASEALIDPVVLVNRRLLPQPTRDSGG